MLSSRGVDEVEVNYNSTNKSYQECMLPCSFSRSLSSSTSSASVSPSPVSPSALQQTPRTMEEVWKDINLASLNEHNTKSHVTTSNIRNIFLQDFLGRPRNSRDTPTSIVSATETTSLYGPASPLPLPATVLSLNCAANFNFINANGPARPKNLQMLQPNHPITEFASFSTPFEDLASASDLPSFSMKKLTESDGSSGDRRHKRMIKNRESAARSRARKQAYTNELELEVHRLSEENAKLKRQQQQLYLAAEASHPGTKKHSLQRSITAPF